MENESMSNAVFDSFLEQVAQLIESKAKTPEEAAAIVRAAKTSEQPKA